MPPREPMPSRFEASDTAVPLAARYHRERRAAAADAGDPHELGLRAYRLFTAAVGIVAAD